MFDKFLTLKNKMKYVTIFYFTMSVSHYHLKIMRKRCYFMFIWVTREKKNPVYYTVEKEEFYINFILFILL